MIFVRWPFSIFYFSFFIYCSIFFSLSLFTRRVFFGRSLSCYLCDLADRFEPFQFPTQFDWSICTSSIPYPVWLIDLNHFSFLPIGLLCAGSSSMIRRVILPGCCGQGISGWVLPLFILRFCPHWFQYGSVSSILVNADPDPDRGPGFDDKKIKNKLTAEKKLVLIKTCNLHISRPPSIKYV
jgi:hypothetical protein